ncbi:MAG: TIGR03663 family protein [Victivallales bacterium]|nr:TIGR03663 family protein [Victivallales bacterium]
MKHALQFIPLAIALAFVIVNARIISVRPMHHDEANQAIRFGDLLEGRGYQYDPQGHHGPTLYYATIPAARLAGARDIAHCTEATIRSVPLAATALLILLIGCQGAIIGHLTAILAAALTAISAPFVFYSTYYIQEPLLVLFAAAAMACIARWRPNQRRSPWLPLAAFFIGLTAATKETWLITIFAMACAIVALAILYRKRIHLSRNDLKRQLPVFSIAVAAFLLPVIVLYSSFFTNWNGPADAVRGLFQGAAQSSQADFTQPWTYFIKRLIWHKTAPGPVWTEWPIIVAAIVGTVVAFLPKLSLKKRLPLQFLAIVAVVQLIVYSAIPYKTPWCILNVWQPIVILAAAGFAVFLTIKNRWSKIICACILAAVAFQQIRQSQQTCGRYCADQRNPYVYSHTQRDLLNLVARVREITLDKPEADNAIVVATSSHQDAWPLPWYFRDRSDVEYRTDWPASPSRRPVFIIATPDLEVDLQIDGYVWETHSLRPNFFLFLGVRQDRWDEWLARRMNETTPPTP